MSEQKFQGPSLTAPRARSIPSLDGLRAASVLIVAVGHSLGYMPHWSDRFPGLQLNSMGQSGVDVFFVISGFLITYLLLKERETTGTIRLKNFYFRRFFRIFPPFYFYLAVLGVLGITGVVVENVHGFIRAATYTLNYNSHGSGWLLGHVWSLSLEEQFYLLWPPCFVVLGKKKSTILAIGVIVLSPVSRFLTYILVPSMRGNEWTMLHTRLDTIMFGCAVALLWECPNFHLTSEKFLHPVLFIVSVLYIVIVAPCLSVQLGARYEWFVGYTLRALLVSLALLYVVKKPKTLPGRLLNFGPIRHLGVISYSLYLWQQMFTGPHTFAFPLNILAALACAELSYRLIEIPAFKARDWAGVRWKMSVDPQVGSARQKRQWAVGSD